MKKLYLAILLICSAFPALAANNPNIEFITHVTCKMGGCTMICTSADGKKDVKAKGINSADIVTYRSGTVQHNLVVGFQKMVVTSPAGTESCALNNVDKIENQ